MAKFLTTTGTSSAIEEIIRKATSRLVLVTPYLMLNKHIEQRLKDADERGVSMTIIYGKKDMSAGQLKFLEQLAYLEIYYCQNLHAKCYYNETTLVMSSMNLYEYSEKNNREIGVQFDINEDQEVFKDACEEIKSIIRASIIQQYNSSAPKLVEPWTKLNNFHLPLLKEMLCSEYKKLDFSITSERITANITENVKLDIDHRVFFRFDKPDASNSLKQTLNEGNVFKERSFSGYKHVSFYLPKAYVPEVNGDSQREIADYFMEYIGVVMKVIS